ncbi:integrase core domain-containing protein [Brevibacillus porteri]|uniref:integrase core domain-containing protein n=1 Tax=Brevibacillus porteri TaxID=2126350 RepID=UPI00370A0866
MPDSSPRPPIGRELRKEIARYVQFYNQERPHQSLNEAKPDQFYAHTIEKIAS